MVWNSAKGINTWLGLLLIAAAAGCSSSSATKGQDAGSAEVRSGPVLEAVTARIYNGNDMQCLIRAKKGHVDLNENIGSLRKPVMSFYSEGKWTGDMTGDAGILFLANRPELKAEKNDIVLKGNIVYCDSDGTMTVPAVRYFSRTGKLVSGGGPFEKRMKMDKGTFICTGQYFETDKDLKVFVGHKARLKMVADNPNQAREPKK